MNAAIISTPTDMRPFVGGHEHAVTQLVSFNSEFEPTIRHLVDRIFHDIGYISADETDLVNCYLDSIEDPLQELNRFGLSILALSTRGTMTLDSGSTIQNWMRTYFLLIPTSGYFQVDTDGARFHHFDAKCRSAMSDLLDAMRMETDVNVRLAPHLIREEHENNVPWCELCCLTEMIEDPE